MSSSSFKNKFLIRLASLLILFSFAFSFLPPPAQGQTEPQTTRELTPEDKPIRDEKRLALVIGNARYEHTSVLKNAVNDARDMANALRELGFEVLYGENQNKSQMKGLMREFGDKLKYNQDGGVGLFFYAGHGVQSGGVNFLVPVDANIPRENEIEDAAVNIGFLLKKLDEAKSDLNIVMLDACRNNPFAKEWGEGEDAIEQGGLAKTNAPRKTVMFYAAEPGKAALDGLGKNGPFTEALLENIKKTDTELDRVIKSVKRTVQEKTKYRQTPYSEGTNFTDFYFAKMSENPKPVVTNTAPVIKTTETEPNKEKSVEIKEKTPAQREAEAWSIVRDTTDEQALRIFLKNFPDGANAEKAKTRLEQVLWDSISTNKDKSVIQAHLNEFPNGANSSLAQLKLRQLESQEKIETKTETSTAVETTPKETAPKETATRETETKPKETETAPKEVETAPKIIAPKETVIAPQVMGKSRFEREAEGWNAVRNSENAQEIRAFLENFPTGANTEKAKTRLEQVLWDARRRAKDKAQLEEHLKEFPKGENAPLVRILLRYLERQEKDPQTTETLAGRKITSRINAAEMRFVFIPAGNFMMGASPANINQTLSAARKDYADFDQSQLSNEKPVRRVTIAQGFWMGRFEVTQAQWAAVMGDNPSFFKGCDTCPVERVSWEKAKIFLRKLNELDDGYVYRVPSEAEWEYAARAGTTGIFSGPVGEMSWHSGNSEDKTHPVGEKLQNPFGLYDIYGNVSEWCEDIYSPTYEGLPVDGSPNTTVGENKRRVLRGGSWNNFPTKSRSTIREPYYANAFGTHIGFRVLAVPK